MFSQNALVEGARRANKIASLPPPVGGLNAINTLATMPPTDASVMTNWIPYPDRLEMRGGCSNHATGFAKAVKSLHTWSGPSTEKLFAVTDDGVFDASAAGAIGATVQALTNGFTTGVILTTGGASVLTLVNGVDSAVQYNGAAWSVVAAFGGLNTNTINGIEVYKQRLYFTQKATLSVWYLAVNSIAGAATEYPMGALFRRGGYVTGIATWTIDSGSGPDDQLVVVTSNGEVGVFSGTDPSSPTTWSLKGIYYIGKPLGRKCLLKYGGDVIFLCETGIYPLSKALLTASIDRSRSLSEKIRPIFTNYVALYRATDGWEALSVPDIPLLLVNIPGTTEGTQLAMHSQTGAWASFSGWNAKCWARMDTTVYYGTSNAVVKAFTGYNDNGSNITATLLQAYNNLGSKRQKLVTMVRPMFVTNSLFQVSLGFAQDFYNDPTVNTINYSSLSSSLWGTGVWGTATWGASYQIFRDWRAVPDRPSVSKAYYMQVSSTQARVSFPNLDILYSDQGTF